MLSDPQLVSTTATIGMPSFLLWMAIAPIGVEQYEPAGPASAHLLIPPSSLIEPSRAPGPGQHSILVRPCGSARMSSSWAGGGSTAKSSSSWSACRRTSDG